MKLHGKSIRLGTFRYHLESRRLFQRGRACSLTGQPLDLLDLLVRNRGRCVTRQDIEAALWPRAAGLVDTSFRLNSTVRSLRAELGESAGKPHLIETIRGRGYRLNCPPSVMPRRAGIAGLLAAAVLGLSQSAAPGPQMLEPSPGDLAAIAAVNVSPRPQINSLQPSSYWPAKVSSAKRALANWRSNPSGSSRATAGRLIQDLSQAGHVRPEVASLQGQLALYADWNWRDAEKRLLVAVAGGAGPIETHKSLVWLYLGTGRTDLVWRHLEVLLSQTPLSASQLAEIGWVLLRMNRPDLAHEVCEFAAQEHVNGLSCLHTALARLGRLDSSRAAALRLMRRLGAQPDLLAQVSKAPAADGYQRFLEWRVHGVDIPDNRWFQRAQILAAAGMRVQAMESLEKALAHRDPQMIKLNSTHEFAALRHQPAYRAIAEQVYAHL